MPTSPAHLRTGIGRAFVSRVLWIALVLAVCNAVLPSLLRVVSAVRGDQVVTICTSFGAQQVQMDSSGQPATEAQRIDACQYCLASQLACLPSLDHPAPAPIVQVSSVLPDRFRVQFDGAHHWPSAQPRAPPTLS